MKNHELLVPAGNMDCLRQAVFNGCDAVYLACKNFGARKFANNFDNDEIVEAIHFCHLYGVKIYVTMNTLIKNDEVDDFIKQAEFLYRQGVDALIVQDFGMICYLREKFPNLEIHASTQANISSYDVCKLYYELGVKRVVFSRELTIDEIDSIDVPIEKEAFIHGALCISYSGCCLMSSMLGGRSGNRGECAGSCRMPFDLLCDGKKIESEKYLLSTKELNTSEYMDRLLKSSIYSFKIEGRMKSPLYVGFVTRMYRRLIDGDDFDLSREIDNLKTIFNREFTKGRLFGEEDKDFMNVKSPNHVGLEIGKVVEINDKKIKIKLNKGQVLNQYDAIRFVNSGEGCVINYLYDKNDNLINSSDSICYIDNKFHLAEDDVVSKTQNYLLEKEFENVNQKKIAITFKIKLSIDEAIRLAVSDGENEISVTGDVVQKALNTPVEVETIERQLKKLGGTPFVCSDIIVEKTDDIFVPIKNLNEIRREAISKLISVRENKSKEVIVNNVLFDKDISRTTDVSEKVSCKVSCFVRNEEQLKKCISLGVDNIYVEDRKLYENYKNINGVFYSIPRCNFSIVNNLVEKNIVSDYANYKGISVVGNYTLNVTNIYTAYYLKKIGLKKVMLSVELNEKELLEFMNLYFDKFGFYEFEIFNYGRVENMIIKGNILNIDDGLYKYSLVDSKKRTFPVFYDGNNTHILNYKSLLLDSIDMGNCSKCFYFYDENSSQIDNILTKYIH